MKILKYTGKFDPSSSISIPSLGIVDWKPGETREIPGEAAASLLERRDEFEEVREFRKKSTEGGE